MDNSIVAAIIGPIGSILAQFIYSLRAREDTTIGHADDAQLANLFAHLRRTLNHGMRLIIVAIGLSSTLVVVFILLSTGPIARIEENAKKEKKTLADFPDSPSEIGVINRIKALDADARALIDGAGT